MSKVDRDMVVDLNGPSGNAFNLLAIGKRLTGQLAEVDPVNYNWEKISNEMQSYDYDHLVETFKYYFGDYVTIRE